MDEIDRVVIDAKLKRYDEFSGRAVTVLLEWLAEFPEELVAVARGRHVTGHIMYGDRNYAAWDHDRLLKETAEELADAINYVVEILQRSKYGQRPN